MIGDDPHGLRILVLLTELDILSASIDDTRVPGWSIVDVAGFESLLVIFILHHHLTFKYVPPVRSLIHVTWKPLQKWSHVKVFTADPILDVYVTLYSLPDLESPSPSS